MAAAEVLDFVLPGVIRPIAHGGVMGIERITRTHKAQTPQESIGGSFLWG